MLIAYLLIKLFVNQLVLMNIRRKNIVKELKQQKKKQQSFMINF